MKNCIFSTKAVLSLLTVVAFISCNGNDPDKTGGLATVNNNFAAKPFSVGTDKAVYFSQGTLQYRASTNTWQFAQNQYDTIGAENVNIAASYDGWIDMFGWGTSGFNDKYPFKTSKEASDYGDGEKDIAGTEYDWGVYNKINNGGNQKGLWRTLTSNEWLFLFRSRTDAAKLYGLATVDGVIGCIVLPDGWTNPNGFSFKPQSTDWSTNTFSASDWKELEANGAVFLPAEGSRSGLEVINMDGGYYWSASYYQTVGARAIYFNCSRSEVMVDGWNMRYQGRLVRLVQDVK